MKKQITLAVAAVVLAGVFAYGFYITTKAASSAERDYNDKYIELTVLEEKQRQARSLEEELAQNKKEIDAIAKALINQTYENKLALIIDIENTAKGAGLAYELNVVKEFTSQSIAEEKARLARSRRKSQQIREEAAPEQFPGIVFSVKLSGSYLGVVNFIERLQRLPYYTDIDNFVVSSKRAQGEGGGAVEATIQFTVFTR